MFHFRLLSDVTGKNYFVGKGTKELDRIGLRMVMRQGKIELCLKNISIRQGRLESRDF